MLDPAETALLHKLCRTADELDALTTAMAGQSPLVEGSQGQPRANPLLAEIRQHRKLAETLAVSLALPVDGETICTRRSSNARKAAHALASREGCLMAQLRDRRDEPQWPADLATFTPERQVRDRRGIWSGHARHGFTSHRTRQSPWTRSRARLGRRPRARLR